MQIIQEPKLDFKDVLILPKVSYIASRAEVDIEREFSYIGTDGNENKIHCLPIIASNMDGVGTFSMAKSLMEHGAFTAIVKAETDMNKWFDKIREIENGPNPKDVEFLIMSAGMGQNELDRIYKFFTAFPQIKMLCLDVANGYNMEFINFVNKVRGIVNPDTFIIAGNVVTGSHVEQLILAGANAVKVGIGSGSVCTTRKVTGVGYPQLSAIIECADAAHGLDGFIVSDGGCQTPGDICKAFGAGADFVMLGGMLAGHDESELTTQSKGIVGIPFHGSSSKAAQTQNGKELAQYRSSEGKEVIVPYRGPVDETMNHISGGIRSACTYIGASKLKDFSKRTTFIRVHNGHQYNTVFGDSSEVT